MTHDLGRVCRCRGILQQHGQQPVASHKLSLPTCKGSINTDEQNVNPREEGRAASVCEMVLPTPIHQPLPSATLGIPQRQKKDKDGECRLIIVAGGNGIDWSYLNAVEHPMRRKTFF